MSFLGTLAWLSVALIDREVGLICDFATQSVF